MYLFALIIDDMPTLIMPTYIYVTVKFLANVRRLFLLLLLILNYVVHCCMHLYSEVYSMISVIQFVKGAVCSPLIRR